MTTYSRVRNNIPQFPISWKFVTKGFNNHPTPLRNFEYEQIRVRFFLQNQRKKKEGKWSFSLVPFNRSKQHKQSTFTRVRALNNILEGMCLSEFHPPPTNTTPPIMKFEQNVTIVLMGVGSSPLDFAKIGFPPLKFRIRVPPFTHDNFLKLNFLVNPKNF